MLSKESESVIQSLESVKGLLTQHVLNAEKLPVEYYWYKVWSVEEPSNHDVEAKVNFNVCLDFYEVELWSQAFMDQGGDLRDEGVAESVEIGLEYAPWLQKGMHD